MEETIILKKLEIIFIDVFDLESISLSRDTSAEDIEEWDSINHVQLIAEIQKQFDVKFSARELLSWDNVGDIVDSIKDKI